MKRYRLKKDLPMFGAGDECHISEKGNLVSKNGTVLYYRAQLRNHPNILKEWFEEIPEKSKTVDDLKNGDECYIVASCISIGAEPYAEKRHYSPALEAWLAMGELYLTKEETEKAIAKQKARTILERDTKGFKPSKENDWEYWAVYYDPRLNEGLDVTSNFGLDDTLPFATREDAEASIKVHEKEWKIYLGVEE